MMASSPGSGNDQETDVNGVARSHAWTILGAHELSNGAKLIEVRNPWGANEKYVGPYNDEDSVWTPELRAEVGAVDRDDGKWFIPIENFY